MTDICRRSADAVGCRRPYNGKVLGGGLWLDTEEVAEKVPVGFDSEEGLAVKDEN
jgi:hypothetical protein